MEIKNTLDPQQKPSVVMLVYGQGGVGKTTFTATAPKPVLADCEGGAKYFGLRGISMDVARIEKWADVEDFYRAVAKSEYETIVVDPIGELMEKLKSHVISMRDKKLVQADGTPTMAGWGYMKDKMRMFIKSIRDLNKHVIIVAHVEEKNDEERIVKRPKVMTKLSEELIALSDIVGFMEVLKMDGEEKRIIRVSPSDKYESKDRTGQLGGIIPPDFQEIVHAVQGNEVYKWSSDTAKAKGDPKPDEKPEAQVEDQLAATKEKTKGAIKEGLGTTE